MLFAACACAQTVTRTPAFIGASKVIPAGGGSGGNVAFDAVSATVAGVTNGGGGNTNTLAYNFTNTLSGASSPIMFVVTAVNHPSRSVSTITANGTSMTLVTNAYPNNNTTAGYLSLHKLANPSVGSNRIVITLNSAMSEPSATLLSAAISFSHVSSVSVIKTNFGSSTAISIGPVSTASTDMILGTATSGLNISAWQPIDRVHYNGLLNAAAANVNVSTTNTTSSATLAWTAGNDWWCAIAVNLAHD